MPLLGFLRRNSDRNAVVDNNNNQNKSRAPSKKGDLLSDESQSSTERTVDLTDHNVRETEEDVLHVLRNLRRNQSNNNKTGESAAANEKEPKQQHPKEVVQTPIKKKRPSPLQNYEDFDMKEFWANPEGPEAARAKDQRREEQRQFLRWQQHESMKTYLREIRSHRDELQRLGIPLTKSRYYPSSSGKTTSVSLNRNKKASHVVDSKAIKKSEEAHQAREQDQKGTASDLSKKAHENTAPAPQTIPKPAHTNVSSEQQQKSGVPRTILAGQSSTAASDLSGTFESTNVVYEQQQQLKSSVVPRTILAGKPSFIGVSARTKFGKVGNDREMKQEAATLFQAKNLLERIRTMTTSSDESDDDEEEDYSCSMITDSHFGDSDSEDDDSDSDVDDDEEADIPVSNLARKLKHVESTRETQMKQSGHKSVFLNAPNGVYCRVENVEAAPFTNEVEC